MSGWLEDDLEDLVERGLYRRRRRIAWATAARVRWHGRELVNFASNDYLDLAGDPRLARAAARAARRYGSGARAAPLVTGYLPPLRRLERDLTRWEGTEAVLVLPSGYQANLAAVATLGRDAVIFSDQLNHASLIDGCRLARSPVHVYHHADVGHLESLLKREGASARRRLIVSDAVFSMDGDLAPLTALYDQACRYDCLLLIDEAHASGVLGEHGRGVGELCQLPADPERVVTIGTLSKALGSQGGFIAGSRKLIDWLANHARPYLFSTALAPPAAAAARRALTLVQAEPERRQHVLRLAERLRAELGHLGLPDTGSRCQIVPLIVGEPRAAVALSRQLEQVGLLVPAIRPPSVPPGTARLRISLSAGHGEEDVQRLVQALKSAITRSDTT